MPGGRAVVGVGVGVGVVVVGVGVGVGVLDAFSCCPLAFQPGWRIACPGEGLWLELELELEFLLLLHVVL